MGKNKKEEDQHEHINTGGGAYIGGDVSISGGDFVGRDKVTIAGDRGIVISGNISGSTLITGDGNVVSSGGSRKEPDWLQTMYDLIDQKSTLKTEDKEDLKLEVKEFQNEVIKGDKADDSFVLRRLRNIKRIAPDIVDVILSTIQSPISGLGVVAKKVMERIKADNA